MDIELRSKVDLLSENYREVKKVLRWYGRRLNIVEALLYGRTDKEIDLKKVKEVRRYLDLVTSREINFTKKFKNIFSILINENKEYKKVYGDTLEVYKHLISKGFLEEEITLFSSFMLANRFCDEELDSKLQRLLEVKNALNGDDYIGYALLATTSKPIDVIKNEFNLVSENIRQAGNCNEDMIKSLTFSLILEDKEIEKKVEKAFEIVCNIKSEMSFLPFDAYPLLGLAAMLIDDSENFSKEIKDVYDMVNEKKTFKFFLNKELKLLFSIGIVLDRYIEEVKADLIDISINDEMNILLTLEECIVFSVCR
ncbi:DUF4003 family protein [Clostridium cibarium]|uniref:DUF4003 family protein n=1 Tax=Clostridium cibarium TaxID=2762247 RepID=A0ABR8PQW0_9CLOT|nr:DUF4003 family protein [Clostridium cibarium]MBD7910547.1 DUF4003 family protein [Clostridium cibarium]